MFSTHVDNWTIQPWSLFLLTKLHFLTVKVKKKKRRKPLRGPVNFSILTIKITMNVTQHGCKCLPDSYVFTTIWGGNSCLHYSFFICNYGSEINKCDSSFVTTNSGRLFIKVLILYSCSDATDHYKSTAFTKEKRRLLGEDLVIMRKVKSSH